MSERVRERANVSERVTGAEQRKRAAAASEHRGIRGAKDIREILRVLPHRYPFVMVDRVVECEAGKRIHAVKNVSFDEPHFVGHFPGDPVMPGVLIVEALAQAGALLAHASGAFDPARNLVYFAGIDKVRFRRPVRPGDQLSLEVEALRAGGRVWKLRGVARVDGKVAAEGELLASIADRDAP